MARRVISRSSASGAWDLLSFEGVVSNWADLLDLKVLRIGSQKNSIDSEDFCCIDSEAFYFIRVLIIILILKL